MEMTPFRYAVTLEYWHFAEMLVFAGYDLHHEQYLLTNEDVPVALILNCEFWTRLLERLATPTPLCVSCRNYIRHILKMPLKPKVDSLPIPSKLKDFLMLKDI